MGTTHNHETERFGGDEPPHTTPLSHALNVHSAYARRQQTRPRYKMISLNLTSGEDPLNLDRIRAVLTRLEDTIIFGLIERAQYAHNPQIYQRGAFKELADLGFKGSWLEWFLKETETFHGALGAYLACDVGFE